MSAGAVNVTVALLYPAVAVPIVGAPGVVLASFDPEYGDSALVPSELVAVSANTYDVPFVRPEISYVVPFGFPDISIVLTRVFDESIYR